MKSCSAFSHPPPALSELQFWPGKGGAFASPALLSPATEQSDTMDFSAEDNSRLHGKGQLSGLKGCFWPGENNFRCERRAFESRTPKAWLLSGPPLCFWGRGVGDTRERLAIQRLNAACFGLPPPRSVRRAGGASQTALAQWPEIKRDGGERRHGKKGRLNGPRRPRLCTVGKCVGKPRRGS